MSSTDAAPEVFLDRLRRIDLRRPRLDRAAVEKALHRYLRAVERPLYAIRWFDNVRDAYAYLAAVRSAVGRAWTSATGRARDGSRHDPAPQRFDVAVQRLHRAPPSRERAMWWLLDAARLTIEWEAADVAIRAACREGMGFGAARDPIADAARRVTGSPGDVRSWQPLIDAAEAGLFLYWFPVQLGPGQEIICVPRPSLYVVSHRLHREDGPAVEWRSGERHWFWHGVEVPRWLIEEPARITADAICEETNVEVRRCMIERFGAERLIDELGGDLVAKDTYGALWRCRLDERGAEIYAVLEVENGTREPDGRSRRYCLRVPPSMRSPREAVAWTYGLQAHEYELAART